MRHPVGTTHLVVGLVFLGLAASWALREAGVVGADGGAWLLPTVLLVAGVAGILASVARSATGRWSDRGPEQAPGDGGDLEAGDADDAAPLAAPLAAPGDEEPWRR